jgi:putative transposase
VGKKMGVTQVCKLFGISRTAWYEALRPSDQLELPLPASDAPAEQVDVETRWATAEALERGIRAIVADNPAWGVRKVWATLRREPYDIRASRKRVWAMMKALGLTLPADGTRPVEPRRGTVVVEEPNRRWSTDMTTVFTAEDGLVAVAPVLDCGCRSVLALGVTKSQDSAALLAPLCEALRKEFGDASGVPWGLELRTDHGPQYTGADCGALCEEWGVEHTFAPVGRPTGNAAGERVIKTMKEECIWLRDWRSLEELRKALAEWVERYNNCRPHQALGWQTPAERREERLARERQAA